MNGGVVVDGGAVLAVVVCLFAVFVAVDCCGNFLGLR